MVEFWNNKIQIIIDDHLPPFSRSLDNLMLFSPRGIQWCESQSKRANDILV